MTDITREIQIAFVGDEGVGKTSIIMRIEQQEFQEDLSHSCGCTFTTINLKFKHDNSTETINEFQKEDPRIVTYFSTIRI